MFAIVNDTGILVVLVAVILLFGASQIPKLARNLGEASREFKKAHDQDDVSTVATGLPAPVAPARSRDDVVTLSRGQLDAILARQPDAQALPGSPATS